MASKSALIKTGNNKGGRFGKGQSGNPKGRPRGSQNKVGGAFREAVAVAFDSLGGADALATWAKNNRRAFYLIAARLAPPGTTINIGPLAGTLADQARAVVERMASGNISPEQASMVMAVVVSQAKIVEVDELVRRVTALEELRIKERPNEDNSIPNQRS